MVHHTDTLIIDSIQIARWKQDNTYYYDRELIQTEDKLYDWLMNYLTKALGDIFNIDEKTGKIILIILAVIILSVLIYFIWRYRSKLFGNATKVNVLTYEKTEDTIYGIDFDAEIARTLNAHNYRNACRLKYLQALKWLSDNKLIDWQLYKTPTQYTYEYKKDVFKQLTNYFLHVRYSYAKVDRSTYNAMDDNLQTILREETKI